MKGSNYDFYLKLGTQGTEHLEFFSVPHLQWLKTFVYNGHFGRHVTSTPVVDHSAAIELSLPVFTTNLYCDQVSNPDPISRIRSKRTTT